MINTYLKNSRHHFHWIIKKLHKRLHTVQDLVSSFFYLLFGQLELVFFTPQLNQVTIRNTSLTVAEVVTGACRPVHHISRNAYLVSVTISLIYCLWDKKRYQLITIVTHVSYLRANIVKPLAWKLIR